MFKRYFRYLGYLWEEAAVAALMAVPVVVEVVRPLPVPDVGKPDSLNLTVMIVKFFLHCVIRGMKP